MAKVHIDFGHGGKDPGSLGNGLREKDITLSIGTKVVNTLKRHNVQVSTSRTNDKFVSLSNRAKMANNANADCFVSIHTNAHDSNAQGVETFSFPNSVNGRKLAQSIQNNVISKGIYTKNRGIKTANFAVLRETRMPSALIETAFITNKEDAKLLKTKQNEFAEAIAKGILDYLRIRYIPEKNPTAPTQNSKGLYKVQVGAFSNKSNADKLAQELKKKGYSTYIVRE